MKLIIFIRKNFFYLFLVLIIVILALLVRLHNVQIYNTWWADDGGGHLQYLQTLLTKYRLPTPAESYLAWHEPLYYLLLVPWIKLGFLLNITSHHWWAAFNILVCFVFLALVWLITYYFSQKNKWLALLNTFIFSILFVGVKLSAYVNNELLNQTLILLLIFLFFRWQILEDKKSKFVVYWSIILAIALLVKMTAFIVLLAAIIAWLIFAIIKEKRYFFKYILICLVIVGAINTPWLIYKQQQFGQIFSINLYDNMPKQNIMTSHAWQYFFGFNYHFVYDYPFWFSKPDSYFAVLISDTFGDYYNMFNNIDRINSLPANEKILVGNGRYTTPELWAATLWTNRLGLAIFLLWMIGFGGYIIGLIKQKLIDKYELFLLIALIGGWLALLYNNLRIPDLGHGVLKAHFIYFTYPLLAIFAYRWWWQKVKNKWLLGAITLIPYVIYLLVAWPMLYLK